MPLDGGERLFGVVEERGDVAVAQQVGGHPADARPARRTVVVHTHHDVGDIALLDHADDGVGDVHVVAEQLLHVIVGRCRRLRRHVEQFAPLFFEVGVFDLVVDGVQRIQPVPLLGLFERHAQADQFVGGLLVGERDQDMVFLLRLLVVVLRIAHCDVVCAPLRGEGRDGAGGEDHQDRAVQDAFAQQADRFAVRRMPEYDVVADHDGRERRRHMGAAQPEDHRTLVVREPEGLLREIGREEFRERNQGDHHQRHFDAFPVAEERPVVDEHAHADQEEGDEDGVSHEFDPVHQGRGAGDLAVEGQPREECTDDRLQPGHVREIGSQEYHRQHEDILRYAVAAMFEKPVRQQREQEQDDADREQYRGAEPPPECFVDIARGHPDDDREQQQGERVGDDRAADCDRDGLVARDAEFADDGVGDKGLRGEEPGQQDRGVNREAQDVIPGQDAESERHAEGVEPEDEAAPAVFLEIGHVHVQPRQEHDVQEAGRSREDDAAIAQNQVQAVGADHRTCDDEPQQIGDFEFVQ